MSEWPAIARHLATARCACRSGRSARREARFPYYQRITAFVAQVHAGAVPGPRVPVVPVVLTCGSTEENLANNRLMAAALAARGYPAALHQAPGGHDFPDWRAALDPHLARLLARLRAGERPPPDQPIPTDDGSRT